jgi:hypothetical protein
MLPWQHLLDAWKGSPPTRRASTSARPIRV